MKLIKATLLTIFSIIQLTKQKISKLQFTLERQEVSSSDTTSQNTQKIDLSTLFYSDTSTEKIAYQIEGKGNNIRSQLTNPIAQIDFSGYNYGNITIMKKLNDSAFAMIFDSQEIGIQFTDSNLTKGRFGHFERGEFYEKGRDPDCHDFARDNSYRATHILCFFADRTKEDPGMMMVYSIFDGYSVRGIKDVDLNYLVEGRRMIRVIKGKYFFFIFFN